MIDLDAAYTILVEECGASEAEWDRPVFVASVEETLASPFGTGYVNYRFCGALGFGGKFRYDPHDDRWFVDCNREDETPERLATIERANARLAGLRAAIKAVAGATITHAVINTDTNDPGLCLSLEFHDNRPLRPGQHRIDFPEPIVVQPGCYQFDLTADGTPTLTRVADEDPAR